MAVSTGQDTFGMVWFKPASEIISEVEQGRLNVIRKVHKDDMLPYNAVHMITNIFTDALL